MYMDRLDGRITATCFDEKSQQWQQQQKRIEEQIRRLQTTELRSGAEAVQTMRGCKRCVRPIC
jgi:hypothetical protein